jgi:nucleoside-diphosphate-sugar epimerase
MDILIAAADGPLAQALIRDLLAAGHHVVGITKSAESARFLEEQHAEPAWVDVSDVPAVRNVMSLVKPEVVIEQLGAFPREDTPKSLHVTLRVHEWIELNAGANLLAAARAAGTQTYIEQSFAMYAAPGPGLADEGTPFLSDGPADIRRAALTLAEIEDRLLNAPNIHGIVLRYGVLYGPGTWFATDGYDAERIRNQQYPIIGDGRGVWSWVHAEDAARATVLAIEHGMKGIYNIVDDQPLAMRTWLPEYARWLGAPAPPTLSTGQEAVYGGEIEVYCATRMRGVSNAKARRELNFRPRPLEWMAAAGSTQGIAV